MTQKQFKATAAILHQVSYAGRYIDESAQTINWSGIWAAEAEAKPSDAEKALVRLAHDCYAGERSIADLAALDHETQLTVINAVNYLIGA